MNPLVKFNIRGTLPDKVYDILKWLALMVLPAGAALYVALGLIWGYTVDSNVLAVITFIASTIGALVGVSANNYYENLPAVKETLGLKIYTDALWLSMYLLPTVSTIYFALSLIVDLPYPDQVISTIVSLNVFLGLSLGLSSTQNSEFVAKFKAFVNNVLSPRE
jgi:Putative phage holin Dp-1